MLPNRPSGRKRWNIHGPKGSLRRLRNQLADDGCVESQYILAKQLLEEECELESDRISNFKQALEWLICATEQGHEEGRALLRRCIRSGVVSENSATIVKAKSCLAANRQESVARKAARDLFASLSNGEEYITTAQLEKRIRDICNVELQKREKDERLEDEQPVEHEEPGEEIALEEQAFEGSRSNGVLKNEIDLSLDFDNESSQPHREIQNLTVDNLVTAAIDYCQGELPLVSYDINLTDPSVKELDHIPLFQQAFLHPVIFIQVLYLKLLYYFNSFSLRLSNLEVMLLFIAYFLLGRDNLTLFAPLVLYYMSFVFMVVSTFKMLHAKRQFVDFRKWSGLFLRYSDGNLHPDESENLFVRNNLTPFIHFFLSLLLNLLLYPFIASLWIPFSEFSVISFFLMFTTLISFSYQQLDILALLSFGINVLAKYPYEKDTVVSKGWRFIDIHFQSYPSYLIGNSIEFCVNSRVLFSLFIPVILILMAKRSNWEGIFKYTIPHCVTLSWLQLFIMCSQGATMYGLVRGTLALVCLFLFLPLIGIVTLILPVMACLQCISLSDVLTAVFSVSVLCAFLTVSCFLAKLESTKKYVTPFQLMIALIALVYVSKQFVLNEGSAGDSLKSTLMNLVDDKKGELQNFLSDSDFGEDGSYRLSWEEYYQNCHEPAWSVSSEANVQLKCSVLNGVHVNWQGYVQEVKISTVTNKWQYLSNHLPTFMSEIFNCYYGEEYSTLCAGDKTQFTTEECSFMQNSAEQAHRRCHLNNMNKYTYQIIAHMETSGALLKSLTAVTLSLDNSFTNLTMLLRQGDKISYKAILSNDDGIYNVGSKSVKLDVYEVHCLSCQNSVIHGVRFCPTDGARSKFGNKLRGLVDDFCVSGKYVLNFILNPVVVIK